jgi:hypothetical protein
MFKTTKLRSTMLERLSGIFAVLILFFMLGMLSGCTGRNKSFDWRKPVTLDMNAPEGPENYRQGWSDGCDSGLASTSNSFHQFIGSYRFVLDKDLRYDKLYNKAWKYGYNHCGYSMKSLAQYSL